MSELVSPCVAFVRSAVAVPLSPFAEGMAARLCTLQVPRHVIAWIIYQLLRGPSDQDVADGSTPDRALLESLFPFDQAHLCLSAEEDLARNLEWTVWLAIVANVLTEEPTATAYEFSQLFRRFQDGQLPNPLAAIEALSAIRGSSRLRM